jgi:hypothetical protein
VVVLNTVLSAAALARDNTHDRLVLSYPTLNDVELGFMWYI